MKCLYALVLSLVVAPAAFATVTVTTPANGATVTSPVTYVASATASTCAKGVASMGIYVDNKRVYVVDSTKLDTQISMAAGAENTVVQEWDNCGGSTKTTINLTVKSGTATVTSIAVTPSPASLQTGDSQQFTATAQYSNGSTVNVTSKATWESSNTSVASVDSTGLVTAVAAGFTTIAATDSGASGSASVTVSVASADAVNVPTFHVDVNRSGLNSRETSLTPANVKPAGFGKLFSYAIAGYAYGEPLIMSNVSINGATHNVLYVATEQDEVYAFDAEHYGTGAPLWKASLLQAGETPLTNGPIQPYEGVTSTPVIDPSTDTLYVVSAQKSSSGGTFRLNALDITTGAQKFGGPVTIHASVPATNSDAVNGVETLTTSCLQRAALLLANGNVYMGFGSCHSGWLVAYNAKTLARAGVFNASPNLNGEGAYASAGGVWMGGGGPVADSSGNIYIVTGNGPWDGKTAFGDSVLKFSPALKLEDYFTPSIYAYLNCEDADLAAGGLLLMPGTSELVAGGKTSKLYVLNSGNLGKESPTDSGPKQMVWWGEGLSSPYAQSCTDSSGTHTANINSFEIFGTAAYYNDSIYLGVTPTTSTAPGGVRQFILSGGDLSAGTMTKPNVQEDTRGTTPFVSSNGTNDGIVWMIDEGLPLQNSAGSPTKATLRAYEAGDLSNEMYNSSQNAADVPGYGIKFTSPVVANGRVYISTGLDLTTVSNPRGEIVVYGLN
ncbi:MAG: Ig-like domain-containing protein [Acidobacteriaceae bacterium]